MSREVRRGENDTRPAHPSPPELGAIKCSTTRVALRSPPFLSFLHNTRASARGNKVPETCPTHPSNKCVFAFEAHVNPMHFKHKDTRVAK